MNIDPNWINPDPNPINVYIACAWMAYWFVSNRYVKKYGTIGDNPPVRRK